MSLSPLASWLVIITMFIVVIAFTTLVTRHEFSRDNRTVNQANADDDPFTEAEKIFTDRDTRSTQNNEWHEPVPFDQDA